MIGFVGGVGRVALTQAGRQVGRQFGREVLERLVGGERLGEILAREEMNLLARRFGKATASLMLSKGKEMFIEDTNNKMENWNNRMNNFARKEIDHFKQQRTLYAEERNVANKEKVEDRCNWFIQNRFNIVCFRHWWKGWWYWPRYIWWLIATTN